MNKHRAYFITEYQRGFPLKNSQKGSNNLAMTLRQLHCFKPKLSDNVTVSNKTISHDRFRHNSRALTINLIVSPKPLEASLNLAIFAINTNYMDPLQHMELWIHKKDFKRTE